MYPENFGFQLFIVLQYFIREIFLKSSLLFNSFYCLLCLKTKVYGSNIKTRTELWMQKLLYLLFKMKRLYICYYIICLTVPLNTFLFPRIMISLSVACIKLKKGLYWNHTSAWVFFCKLAVYCQNTFHLEHLWTDGSVSCLPRRLQKVLEMRKTIPRDIYKARHKSLKKVLKIYTIDAKNTRVT